MTDDEALLAAADRMYKVASYTASGVLFPLFGDVYGLAMNFEMWAGVEELPRFKESLRWHTPEAKARAADMARALLGEAPRPSPSTSRAGRT